MTKSPPEVGLSCESVEQWITTNHGQPLPGTLRRHLDRCPPCRKEYESALPLGKLCRTRVMAGPAPRSASGTDPFFLRSVMARVRSEMPPIRRRERNRRRGWRVAAMVTLAAGVGVFLLKPEPEEAPLAQKHAVEEPDAVPSTTEAPRRSRFKPLIVYEGGTTGVASESGFIPAFRLPEHPEILRF